MSIPVGALQCFKQFRKPVNLHKNKKRRACTYSKNVIISVYFLIQCVSSICQTVQPVNNMAKDENTDHRFLTVIYLTKLMSGVRFVNH